MDYESALNETRTNAEQSETDGDFRVSFESREPSRSNDGRLMYFEHQLQRSDTYSGFLDELNMSIEEMRALFGELADYFGVCSYWHFELPPAGLPGLLHAKYDRDEEAADLLRLGMDYVGARIRNERKAMHNRWRDARDLIRKIEERTEERIVSAQIQREVDRALAEEESREPQAVYFIGSQSGPIKIGIAVRPMERLKTLQTGHHEKLELLAICQGGQKQERAYHKRFAKRRLNGEWFERCSEIEAEIERIKSDLPK